MKLTIRCKKILALILVLLLTLGALSSCGNGGTSDSSKTPDSTLPASQSTEPTIPNAPITVTDLIGREVDILPGSYRKVVCIGAGALRMYAYIGNMSLLCGVEDIDNTSLSDRPKMFDSAARPYVIAYGELLNRLPSCGVGGPNAQTAEAEKILACAPDIVISEYADADLENALQEQLGVPVITLRSGIDGVFAEDFKESLHLLGQIFDKGERAQSLISFIDAESAEITRRTANAEESSKPAVYLCGLGNWGTANHLTTAEAYAPFRIANIRNAVAGLGIQKIGTIEAETFVSVGAQTDILILDAAAVKNIAPLYREDPTMFDTCLAWQSGEVYLEMAYNAYYTNYEIALANTWYAAKVTYPALFEDIDMTAKLGEITVTFLGQDLSEEIFSYPTSFGGYQKIDTTSFFR